MSVPSPSEMSPATKVMLAKVRKLVPPMLEKFHKGQLGRVAVIGGSADYTGAPYFSAMASARLGCDLSHVICEPSASPVIKSYSPNLMVHPFLYSTNSAPNPQSYKGKPTPDIPSLCAPIVDLLPRLHTLVIGPGLGRDDLTLDMVAEILQKARERNMPFVLDADGLFLIQKRQDLVNGYKDCILTPNVVEFGRLAKAFDVDIGEPDSKDACSKVARALGGVTIIQKGRVDIISNGLDEEGGGDAICDIPGGLKRSGGQGDTLTGSLGTFLAWREIYHEGLWDVGKDPMTREETLVVAAWAGAAITRECSRRAFAKRGRSLQASDLTEEVEGSFSDLIGEPDGSEAEPSKL